jgi:hypothetical protein
MATAIGLAMQITANTSGLASSMSKVETLLNSLGRTTANLDSVFKTKLGSSVKGLQSQLASFGVTVPVAAAGLAAFGAGAAAITANLLRLEDRVENLGNKAAQLGVSFGFVQVLENAAARSGTSIDGVAAGIARLQNSLLGVDEESKKARVALANLGITAEDLRDLSPARQYLLLADALKSIEDPARRTATAISLFGKSGVELLPFFNNIGKAAVDMQRLGGAMNDLDKRRLDEFGDGIDALTTATSRVFDILGATFAGLGEGVAKGLGDAIGGLAAAIEPVLDLLAVFLDLLGLVAQAAGAVVNVLGNLIGATLEVGSAIGETLSAGLNAAVQPFEETTKAIQSATAAFGDYVKAIPLIGPAYASVLSAASTALNAITRDTEAADEATSALAAKLSQQQLADQLNRAAAENSIAEQIAASDAAASQQQLNDLLLRAGAENNIREQVAAADADASRKSLDDLLSFEAARRSNEQQIADADAAIAEATQRLDAVRSEQRSALGRRSNEALRVNDIRSGGIDEVLRLASGREDPSLAEARRQTAELERLRQEIVKLGGTVDILGAA